MLITHHPLIFSAVKKVTDEDFITRRVIKLIRNDISYYAMHTNFDAAPGCMADVVAESGKAVLRRVGIQDQFGMSAPYERLLEMNGITAEHIVELARGLMG